MNLYTRIAETSGITINLLRVEISINIHECYHARYVIYVTVSCYLLYFTLRFGNILFLFPFLFTNRKPVHAYIYASKLVTSGI